MNKSDSLAGQKENPHSNYFLQNLPHMPKDTKGLIYQSLKFLIILSTVE